MGTAIAVVPAGVRVAGNRRDREKGNHSSDSKPATMGQHLSLFSSEFFAAKSAENRTGFSTDEIP